MKKIGINGLGRVGRLVFRICLQEKIKIDWINELNATPENIVYLLTHDTSYGNLDIDIKLSADKDNIIVNGQLIRVFRLSSPDKIYEKYPDLLKTTAFECTGVAKIAENWDQLCKQKKVFGAIASYYPKELAPPAFVLGASTDIQGFNIENQLVSGAICDVVATAEILLKLNNSFTLKSGSILSIHPWLSYQNLVDGYVSSVHSPGHSWMDFSLGRDATNNIIPKNTTLLDVMKPVIGHNITTKLVAMSLRVPTATVTASYLNMEFEKKIDVKKIHKIFEKSYSEVTYSQSVSSDYKKMTWNSVIDGKFTKVFGKNNLRLLAWYDNEWGYAFHLVQLFKQLCTYEQ